MANETTTTTWAARIATEILARIAIAAHLPLTTLLRMVHTDNSLDGANSGAKDYTVRADLGQGSGGTEGTDLTANTAISMGSSVTATPTEIYADRAIITLINIQRAFGLTSGAVDALVENGSREQWMDLLREDVNALVARGIEEAESLMLAELGNVSGSVGSTGVDISVTNLLEAIYTNNTQQPLRPRNERRFLLTMNQVHEINVAALTGSGGVNGVWNNQAQIDLFNNNPMFEQGPSIEGAVLKYPVHVYDEELNVTANMGADVVGAFGAFGIPGVAPDDPRLGGRCGAMVFAEQQPLTVRFDKDISMRGMEVVANWYADPALIDDAGLTAIITDAP